MKINELFEKKAEKRDHLKEWVTKRLWHDWQHDPIMPAKERDIESMEMEDQELFWNSVKEVVEYLKNSKLPLEAAYDDYVKDLEKRGKKEVYKHYN